MYFLGGSSPRMRGTHVSPFREFAFRGIIPAYAGNTPVPCFVDLRFRDHPRVCGEHSPQAQNLIIAAGSSPRMRGTPHHDTNQPVCKGIIPAYAGNTYGVAFASAIAWDHPRVCGEHLSMWRVRSCCLGSSPRMRGTPEPELVRPAPHGIIPAYAGNTTGAGFNVSGKTGSSPRMRGTRVLFFVVWYSVGIIPAYAGNT